MANAVAYGFVSLQNLFDQRVIDTRFDIIDTAITSTLNEHNRQLDAIMRLFASPTVKYKERYKTPTTARLMPLDENGAPRPVRVGGFYDVGYPLHSAGIGWGANFVARQTMNVGEMNEIVNTITMADIRWVRDHILSGLFSAASWVYPDDMYGNITVKPLASGDTDLYTVLQGADAPSVDTHLLAQAGDLVDATDPFSTIFSELTEHPENQGDVIVLLPTNLKAKAQALTQFVAINDPNLRYATTATTLNAAGTSDTLGFDNVHGTPVPGVVFGYHKARVWLTEWKVLPNDYMIAVTADGERPLAMRQRPETSLQGLVLLGEDDRTPFFQRNWMRSLGFGARNRIGALVYRVNNAVYASPSVGSVSYQAPIS